MPRPGRGEGIPLAENDYVQKVADREDFETLNLSGSIDILWQLKGMAIRKDFMVRAVFTPSEVHRCLMAVMVVF